MHTACEGYLELWHPPTVYLTGPARGGSRKKRDNKQPRPRAPRPPSRGCRSVLRARGQSYFVLLLLPMSLLGSVPQAGRKGPCFFSILVRGFLHRMPCSPPPLHIFFLSVSPLLGGAHGSSIFRSSDRSACMIAVSCDAQSGQGVADKYLYVREGSSASREKSHKRSSGDRTAIPGAGTGPHRLSFIFFHQNLKFPSGRVLYGRYLTPE